VNNEAKHLFIASTTFFLPRIFKYVSCCPAKEAFGKSSAMALERIATSNSFL
jgi:hypothetical protein